MSFTTQEYRQFIQLLSEHPEWRDDLRRLLLTEELLGLPRIVAELAESHKRAEERLTRLEAVVAQLVEAQKHVEERLTRLEAVVAQLVEAQKHVEERLTHLEAVVAQMIEAQKHAEERLTHLEAVVAQMIEAQKHAEERLSRLEAIVAQLAEAQRRTELEVQRLAIRMARVDGRMLESEYRNKAASYFGKLVRRARVVDLSDLEELVEAELSPEELQDVLRLDLLVRGRPRQAEPGEKVEDLWLAVEISIVVDREDVERAYRRAELLRKAGLRVLPVAAGERSTEGAQEIAREKQVVLLQDGVQEI